MSDHEFPADSLSETERLIRAAGSYVGASDDLRPRTLEAAREQSSEVHAKQRLTHLILAIGLVMLLISPVMEQVSKLPVPTGASSHEVERRTAEQARSSADFHWTMVDI